MIIIDKAIKTKPFSPEEQRMHHAAALDATRLAYYAALYRAKDASVRPPYDVSYVNAAMEAEEAATQAYRDAANAATFAVDYSGHSLQELGDALDAAESDTYGTEKLADATLPRCWEYHAPPYVRDAWATEEAIASAYDDAARKAAFADDSDPVLPRLRGEFLEWLETLDDARDRATAHLAMIRKCYPHAATRRELIDAEIDATLTMCQAGCAHGYYHLADARFRAKQLREWNARRTERRDERRAVQTEAVRASRDRRSADFELQPLVKEPKP